MQYKHFGWLAIFWIATATVHLEAQSNILAGYKLAYTEPKIVDDIIADYNMSTMLEQPMTSLRDLHGILFGYRYRFGRAGVEVSWSNVGATLRSEGLVSGAAVNKRIGWSITQYDAGLQLHSGVLSFGSGIGYRRIKTETDIDGLDVDREVFNDTEWVINAQIGIEVNSERIAFALQPYLTYPIVSTDVSALQSELLPAAPMARAEDFLTFGLKVVLYNGPQR